MKNKFLDYFVFIGIVLYSLGFVITLIFLYLFYVKGKIISFDQTVLYIPLFLFGISSIFLLFIYYMKKKKSFELIKMHVNAKWIKLHDLGFIGLMISICINIFLIGFITKFDTFAIVHNPVSGQDVLPNIWYFYFIIGISLFLFMVFYVIISVSIFRIKIDLHIRKMGEDFSKHDDSTLIKKENSKDIEKIEVTSDFISFDNQKIKNDKKDDQTK